MLEIYNSDLMSTIRAIWSYWILFNLLEANDEEIKMAT